MSQNFDDRSNQAGASEDDTIYYTLEVTTSLTRLGSAVVERCVQIGLIRPAQSELQPARYSSADVVRLRKVRRLIQELGLNWAGVEIVMRLTDELDRLHAELENLRLR